LPDNAAATLVAGVSFQEKNVFRSSRMSISNSNITTEVIADFAAGRLNTEDTQAMQDASDHDQHIAAAVLDARQVVTRMNIWWALPARAASAARALTARG
jgi:hypothetical protein